MPDTIESDFIPEPTKAKITPPATIPPRQDDSGAINFSFAIPDFMPLLDVAEGRINYVMDAHETALRSAMFVSAAGLGCGTIWARAWREIRSHAVTSAWRTSQVSVAAASDLMDRWMDLQVQAMDATAARLAEAT